MIICGTAGTRKSFLITAIAYTLGDTCLLTGTTGLAGFNICGTTLHSTLQLPVQSHNNQELQGPSLARLQQQVTGKNYLIIDEMSMLGQRMMSWVDKQLRQATEHLEQPVGGISVILLGDFGQLPPVGDRSLFSPSPVNPHGHTIYKLFKLKLNVRMEQALLWLHSVNSSCGSVMAKQVRTTGNNSINVPPTQ